MSMTTGGPSVPTGVQRGSSELFDGPYPDEPNLSVTKVKAREGSAITKLSEPLKEDNWMAWRERMKRILRLCCVEEYVEGIIECPTDAEGVKNWKYNDNYAQVVIINNITSTEMVHINRSRTAKSMWDNLEAVHESKGHQTIVSIIRNLFHTKADEETNINEHLNQLKQYWERINQMNEEDFKISDVLFKIIISSSLPLSWDTFTESYVGGRKGVTETDPKKLMGSQQFIGILKEEYIQRQLRAEKGEMTNQAFIPKRSLQNRITSKSNTNSGMSCKQCGRNNHNTIDCKHLGKSKCSLCGKFGHTSEKCWDRDKGKRKRENDDGKKGRKRPRKEETNEGEEENDDEEIITLNIEEVIPQEECTSTFFDSSEEGQYYNFNSDNTYNMHEINEPVIYYDWFGDSATSSHVTNRRDIFTTYQHLHNTSVVGVGRLKAKAEGKGTIELESRYNNKTYILKLENVSKLGNMA